MDKFAGANGHTPMCLVKYDTGTTELIDLRQGRVYPLGDAPLPKEPFRNLWFNPAAPKSAPPPTEQYYYTTPVTWNSFFDCITCNYLRFAFGVPDEPVSPEERVRVKKKKRKKSNQMIWPWQI